MKNEYGSGNRFSWHWDAVATVVSNFPSLLLNCVISRCEQVENRVLRTTYPLA